MNITQSLNLAIKSLLGSKMRSFLTMLGIIIGVGAVIVIVSTINGMTSDVTGTFESLGATNLNVTIFGRGGNISVDVDDMLEIVNKNPGYLSAVTPSVSLQGATIKKDNENLSTTSVTGVNEYYSVISDKPAETGRALTYADCENRLANCVVGTYVAKTLFGKTDVLGEAIKINGKTFNIVGIMEEDDDSRESGADDAVLIPYTIAQKMSGNYNISSYTFCAASKDTADFAQTVIENELYRVFKDSDAYHVTNMASILDTITEITSTMSVVGAAVAGISLLVGGIGIMNIMLVSVTERTREIGIRKSLGASPFDIMSQFVVEAITTSCIGGILGIIFGILGARLVDFMGMTTVISIPAIIISFTVSALIGVIFGYLPAKKASRLNPIDALRYD